MTRDEIIAKWAGLSTRERDAWVSAVVLGWEWREPDGEDAGWYERVYNAPFYDRVFTGRRHGWSPSTDISAAWAVWSAMLAKGYEPLINTTSERSGSVKIGATPIGWYHVCLHKDGVNTHAELPTAPEALCLAALIAKLTEVNADGE